MTIMEEAEIYLGKFVTAPDSLPRIGGFSKVYKCIDRTTTDYVAVKVMKIDNPLKRRFYEREVEALTKLNHESIMGLIDYGTDGDEGYIVLPWFEKTLIEFLETSNLSRKEIFNQILLPVLDGLAFAHERQVFHRDLNPRNILVNDGGVPIISDFGSAKVFTDNGFNETRLRTESLPYTPEHGNVAEIDVYSFGAVAIELLSKEKAFSHNDLEEILTNSGEGKPGIAPETKTILQKCINLKPEERYRSAVELKEIFDKRALRLKQNETQRTSRARFILTAAASKNIVTGLSQNANVEKFVNEELNSSVLYASPKRLEIGGYARDEFWLVTNQTKFLLKAHELNAGWVAVAAHLEDIDDLEYLREKGFPLEKLAITWECVKDIPNDSMSHSGFDAVREAYSLWIKHGRPEREMTRIIEPTSQELFGKWGRVLDAHQYVYSNRFKPLKFVDSQFDNDRLYLRLEEAVEFEIEDSYWKIPFSEKEAFGTVDFHDGVQIEIQITKFGKGKISKQGTINPEIEVGNEQQIKRQREALQAIGESSTFNIKLGRFLTKPDSIPKNMPINVTEWKSEIDSSKQVAISKALANSGVMIVKGPPGTGKTSFIAEYIYQELQRSRSSQILLVSQTHVALDNALTRLAELGIDDVVRLGNPNDPRISKTSKKLLVDNQMLVWKEKLRKDSARYIEKLAESANLTMPQTQSLIILEAIEANFTEIGALVKQLESKDVIYSEENEEVSEFSKKRIIEKRDALVLENDSFTQDLRKLAPKVGITIPKDYDSKFVIDFRDAIVGVNKDAARVAEIARVQQKWILKAGASSQVEPIFLHSRRVLAGTCLGFLSNRNVRELNFDVCIIDEASKASITESLVPMSKARRTVLVGDSSQLSPGEYLLNPEDKLKVSQQFQLDKGDFESSMISYLEESLLLNDSQYSQLDVQYRMRDSIGAMVSTLFYSGGLNSINHTKDEIRLGLLMGAVDWRDTGAVGLNKGIEHRVGDSYSNRFEIDVIKDRLTILTNALGRVINPDRKLTVLVIAPYAAQVELARSNLNQFNSNFLYIEFNTIDAVQGREADIVFFSTVRNNQNGRTGFLSKSNWRRINVALSRARLNLTIVGNLGFWESSDSSLSDVVSYLKTESIDNSEYRIEDARSS